MKTKLFYVFLLAFAGLSNGAVAQSTFYVNPGETLRVKCWDEDGSGNKVSLDTDCQINLNGDRWGNNADTIITSGEFYMEAGSESSDYFDYSWIDGPDEYTHLIYDPGGSTGEWSVGKYNQATGYEYIGTFYVKFVYDVTFTVTDAGTGDPIVGATVHLYGYGEDQTLTTDASGICVADSVANNSYGYDYTVTASGYENSGGTVIIDKADVSVNVSMTASSGSAINDVDGINLRIYPNPCTSSLHILNTHCSWEVYDMTGRILSSGSGSEVNVENLKAGNYVLKIKTAEGSVIKKILKQ